MISNSKAPRAAGWRDGRTKFSPEQVRAIRELAGRERYRVVAELFGTTENYVARIVAGYRRGDIR